MKRSTRISNIYGCGKLKKNIRKKHLLKVLKRKKSICYQYVEGSNRNHTYDSKSPINGSTVISKKKNSPTIVYEGSRIRLPFNLKQQINEEVKQESFNHEVMPMIVSTNLKKQENLTLQKPIMEASLYGHSKIYLKDGVQTGCNILTTSQLDSSLTEQSINKFSSNINTCTTNEFSYPKLPWDYKHGDLVNTSNVKESQILQNNRNTYNKIEMNTNKELSTTRLRKQWTTNPHERMQEVICQQEGSELTTGRSNIEESLDNSNNITSKSLCSNKVINIAYVDKDKVNEKNSDIHHYVKKYDAFDIDFKDLKGDFKKSEELQNHLSTIEEDTTIKPVQEIKSDLNNCILDTEYFANLSKKFRREDQECNKQYLNLKIKHFEENTQPTFTDTKCLKLVEVAKLPSQPSPSTCNGKFFI